MIPPTPPTGAPLRIVWFMRHAGYLRNFLSTLLELSERGHEVHVAFDRMRPSFIRDDAAALATELAEAHPRLTFGEAPDRGGSTWAFTGTSLRELRDYLRYHSPVYREAESLRRRAGRRLPLPIRVFIHLAGRSQALLRATARALAWLECGLPLDGRVRGYLAERSPDLVLVTPLVELGSPQADLLRGARALGIPTGLCVASWDNLTNKGLIQQLPDLVTVWNEDQKREAEELHGVPAERIEVTGAQPYDFWFEQQPSRTHERFCEEVGLDPRRQYVLWVCSSSFVAPEEPHFIREWLRELRTRAPSPLRDAGILIRPHPQNVERWAGVDLAEPGRVAVWPTGGSDTIRERNRQDYFDSIAHAAAVAGINTSALIEASILGRPLFSVLAPDFRHSQTGTLHFSYLLRENGGPLETAASLEEHFAQLNEALVEERAAPDLHRAFLERFVRPHSLEEPATPRLVEAIERAPAGAPAVAGQAGVHRPWAAAGILWLLRPGFAVARRVPLARPGGRCT